uniref:Uncharacterized protein n=1 Tax=Sus scrofa TaxID=9823 RepID=A0A8D1FZR5_PIG
VASFSELTCIYSAFIHGGSMPSLNRRQWKQGKNLRSLMITWALGFWTKPPL